MAKVPVLPIPDTIAATPVATITRSPDEPLWRIYCRRGQHPMTWNRWRHVGPLASARCDHHEGRASAPREQQAGVLYAGDSPRTCLAEVFQGKRTINRGHNAPSLAAFHPTRPLELIDCTGVYLTRIGASLGLFAGRRDVSRNWTRALYAAHPRSDGLTFVSTMHPEGRVIVLNERAKDCAPRRPAMNKALDDPTLLTVLRNEARELGYGLV